MLNSTTIRKVAAVLMVFYILIIIKYVFLDRMLFVQIDLPRAYNLIPFRTISNYWANREYYNTSSWVTNLVGNVFMLVPFGVLAPIIWKSLKKPVAFLLVLFAINLGIELIQLITKIGSFDVDDLILNYIGAVIAYCVTYLFSSAGQTASSK